MVKSENIWIFLFRRIGIAIKANFKSFLTELFCTKYLQSNFLIVVVVVVFFFKYNFKLA